MRCYGPALIGLSQLNISICQKCRISMTQIYFFLYHLIICGAIIITSVLMRGKKNPIKNLKKTLISEPATTDPPPSSPPEATPQAEAGAPPHPCPLICLLSSLSPSIVLHERLHLCNVSIKYVSGTPKAPDLLLNPECQ